jgi:hypothetical protein
MPQHRRLTRKARGRIRHPWLTEPAHDYEQSNVFGAELRSNNQVFWGIPCLISFS